MMIDHSDQLGRHFTIASCDVTPVSVRHAACVLYAPFSRDPKVARLCTPVLSDAELHRADRFVGEDNRAQFEQRRAFRRFCGATAVKSSKPLSQIVFEETEIGRPYLSDFPELWFSFSSCRLGFLGAWSWTHGVGVDVENQTRTVEATELARRFFSGAEANAVEGADSASRTHTFFQLWSLKEAALKSIGEGLPFGLDAFEFELDPDLRLVQAPRDHGGAGRFVALEVEGTGCFAAAVLRHLA